MGIVVSAISNVLYVSEKISLCFTCTVLLYCKMITLVATLCLGIGLGYNYCFVDMKTRFRYVSGDSEGFRRHGPKGLFNRVEPKRQIPIKEVLDFEDDELGTSSESETMFETSTTTMLPNTTKASSNNATVGSSTTITNTSTVAESISPPKMVIPISGLDLIALLSKLRTENRNYSLQIVTS
ncbi:uncharacterized protein LOC114251308 [Bombyx mandarina]|uniref:Uncharacterized protein LOC114251308 n=1 Tax=Bombyx mandarina TaxID=7092 RepID=A0A6J2KMG1_BOMMA|nr:uncharacterized protein LOC114251308 [Bombyx mandarina]